MDKQTELLLAEARVYKEEIKRSRFMLSQFCERLRLTENRVLTSQADSIIDAMQVFEKISTLLGDTAAELEKEPEAEIIDESPATEEAPAFSIASEEDFVFAAPADITDNAPAFINGQSAEEELPIFSAVSEIMEESPVFSAVPEVEAAFSVSEAGSEIREDAPVFGFADVFSADAVKEDSAPVSSFEFSEDAPVFTPVFDSAEEAPVFTPVFDSSEESPVFTPADEIMQRFIEEEPVFVAAASDAPEEDNELKCENCGNAVKSNYAFCSVCGTKLKKAEERSAEKEQSFSDFLAHQPALSQNVFPDFNDVEEEESFDEKDFLPRENAEAVNNAAPSISGPAVFLVNHRDNSIIPITKNEFLIGRDPAKTDYCISDNSAISRVHAKIYFEDGRYFISDCNSVNGTYINETRIMPSDSFVLFDGSEIRLNTERFTFRIS